MLDLHRHSEFSNFDGFGKALDLAKLAKEQGLTALGISDHGATNGMVDHWLACTEVGIKPILGVEAYFQPKFNRENPVRSSFHLCLFAKNLEGYRNLNRIMSIANIEQKYYKPITDFALLAKYSEGVICTSGCIASFISQMIVKGNDEILEKALKQFIKIYGDNFYIEIQPYAISEVGLQEKVNIKLIKLAKQYNLKMILTSDSHYGDRNDYDTYCKMHEIKGSGEYNETYKERYMPLKEELVSRLIRMHEKDFKNIDLIANRCIDGLNEIEETVDGDILGKLELSLPKISDNSKSLLKKMVVDGLKGLGKYNKKYLDRCKTEYDIVAHHGFEDYYLIVQDYVKWAKSRGIKVGPGRGSVCNSLLAYALGITTVDSIHFDLDFQRFMRMDKAKLPDIDLDFETDRRNEVIEYIIDKYPGKAARICSYGLYKVDNLINDLCKVSGIDDAGIKREIKEFANKFVASEELDKEGLMADSRYKSYNKAYDDIMKHFVKMYKKVRYFGTHAAGVALFGSEIQSHVSLDNRGGKISVAYNLNDLEAIHTCKLDVLGLRTLSISKEMEEMTNECFHYDWLEDPQIYEYFETGKTDGIFQYESRTAKDILVNIGANTARDVIAASALNRPGPLSLKMPDQYRHNKENIEDIKRSKYYKYTEDSLGVIMYQEQSQRICVEIGGMDWSEADKMIKMDRQGGRSLKNFNENYEKFKAKFVPNAMKNHGYDKEEALHLYESLINYLFNKGHAVGYGLISIEQMYYKVHHPVVFWYATLKYAATTMDLLRLKIEAIKEGNVILLPHVNYGARYKIVKVDGQQALAEGLVNILNVGEKAAETIETERLTNGPFKSYDDFLDRVPKRSVNSRVVEALLAEGALEFNKKTYMSRVVKYNSSLYMRSMR